MPIYINGKGEQKDTADMIDEYIVRALAKAKQQNNQANIDALEEEINKRNGS